MAWQADLVRQMVGRRETRGVARALALPAACLLLPPLLLTGCASDQDRYCEALAESAPELERLSDRAERSPAASALASVPILADLADQAPPELVDEWTTVMNALRTFRQVVRESGVETGPGAADAVEALPPARRDAVQRAAARLVDPAVIEASAGIEDYGTQVCDVSVGL